MTENPYAPGTYAKGDDVRVANTARDAVALVFAGFKPVTDAPAAAEEPVTDAPADETPATPTPVPSPKALARKQSQEDNQS